MVFKVMRPEINKGMNTAGVEKKRIQLIKPSGTATLTTWGQEEEQGEKTEKLLER